MQVPRACSLETARRLAETTGSRLVSVNKSQQESLRGRSVYNAVQMCFHCINPGTLQPRHHETTRAAIGAWPQTDSLGAAVQINAGRLRWKRP